MTKEDVRNFLNEHKDEIAYAVGLTVTCICVYTVGTFMYKSGYARGVTDVSNNACKFLGYDKYEELRLGMINAIESSK